MDLLINKLVMNRSTKMRQKNIFLVCVSASIILAIIIFSSCTNSKQQSIDKLKKTLVGNTFYILDERIDFSNYDASVKEIKLDFFSPNKLEARMTFYADALGYQTDTTEESAIIEYKYEDGLFELPSFNLIAKAKVLDNGSIKLSTGDILYTTSIVNFLSTDSAFNRVNETTKNDMGSIYKDFLKKPYKAPLRIEGNNIIAN